MNTHADQPIIRNVRVRQGESIKLQDDGHSLREVTCDDIARLALAIHDKSYFFSRRRGLEVRFSRDINGSGVQLLEITRRSDETNPPNLIDVLFDCTYKDDGKFLYEADLITDQRKDYEPTINRGKHQFVATMANMRIDWNSDETLQWRSDIDRLSKSPDTLAGWLEADLEMLVICSAGFLICDRSAILNRSDIARHVLAGLSLEALKTRLTCSKCGKRQAHVLVF